MVPIHRGPLADKTVLVTGGSAGIGKATALGLAIMEPALRSPAGTVGAPRTRLGRSGTPAAGRWTCSSATCPPSRRSAAWRTRC